MLPLKGLHFLFQVQQEGTGGKIILINKKKIVTIRENHCNEL